MQSEEIRAPQLGETTGSKMRITVFANTVSTYSIDRYVRELVRNFPQTVEAKAIYFHPSSGGIRQQIDRYWGYIQLARREHGDYNIIAAEGCAYQIGRAHV